MILEIFYYRVYSLSIGFSGEEENNRTALQYLSISMTDVTIKERQLLKFRQLI